MSGSGSEHVRLDKLLMDIRHQKLSFKEGLVRATKTVELAGGEIETEIEGGQHFYHLTLDNEKATCFQPYPDIDLFYYEM